MSIKEIYQQNKEFKEYMDKFLSNNPEYTFEQASNHLIIKDIAEYYINKYKGVVENGRNKK